ncbi:unnamed protein product [Pleuronectes platessa]|uniref:Uncharacterized protein n=1 Tax=Pleuronectes platessa TaxID=8262 RepID=A0A9N7VC13_PLEPL|nr:unnamed protein product [Pleuronectes platessa]
MGLCHVIFKFFKNVKGTKPEVDNKPPVDFTFRSNLSEPEPGLTAASHDGSAWKLPSKLFKQPPELRFKLRAVFTRLLKCGNTSVSQFHLSDKTKETLSQHHQTESLSVSSKSHNKVLSRTYNADPRGRR